MLFCCSAKTKKENISRPRAEDKIDIFWNWFADNKEKFEDALDQDLIHQDEKLELILAQLRKIEDGLAVEISAEHNGTREIIISPEGDRSKFDIVQAIVSRAPNIDKWTVTAFRQRAPEGFSLKIGDIEFEPAKMYFDPLIDVDSLDVIVYAENFSKHDENEAAYYGLITLDNVLGEYDCVMKVRHYDFRDTGELPKKHNLKHLTELPKFVDDFHSARKR
ncbi:hypothetical protein SAMN04488109_5472 [Chryseolinea serpens]|uniref:DUF695 domain-containing protein n=2 Tax=Chryseolinea serpens TaxID=947013 RepID=A0A1M5VWG2_9BACT|nr:hypothetical protein SAMN04488109_5472 [Chryseolinea serpens]